MLKQVLIFLKGIAMGAANIVPGVSGGTIAFITGIYDELLAALSAINFNTLKILRKDGLRSAWSELHGNFMVSLFAGILLGFFTLARVFEYLLDTSPHLVYAFFFGLIIGSILLVGKMILNWNLATIVALIAGTAISFGLTLLQPGAEVQSSWYIFAAGFVAVCALILPGISGAFILLLMGLYYPMLEAVRNFDLRFILIVGLGSIAGLLSFSRLLKWALDNYKGPTIAFLTGFLVGSLNEIWPWKETLEYRTNSHGKLIPLIEENILPSAYDNPQIVWALIVVVVGIGIIYLLSKFTPEVEKK